jgi:transposase
MDMLEVMATRDARSLDHRTLEEMRRVAVRAVLGGETQRAVAGRLQVHHQTVCKWMHWYRGAGDEGLASTKAPGPKPKLSERQAGTLRRIIVGKNPRQLNFGSALWTLPIVGQVIEARFGVVLHATNIMRLLRRLGLTPQKPVRRAFQRDDAECRHWMRRRFPEIVREAKRKQAVLLFADETGVHENHPVGRTWGERGRTPLVDVSGSRRRINVISAISPRGQIWFRCYKGNLNAPRYVEFLKDLLREVRGKVILVHDRHPAHIAAATRRFLAERSGRLAVHELPSYAPDLNPDEHLWSYLKGTFKSAPLHPDEDLDRRVLESMENISADRGLVRSFFEHPQVHYVKDALGW